MDRGQHKGSGAPNGLTDCSLHAVIFSSISCKSKYNEMYAGPRSLVFTLKAEAGVRSKRIITIVWGSWMGTLKQAYQFLTLEHVRRGINLH